MNLYVWQSELLEGYRPGQIIIMAESVGHARTSARQKGCSVISEAANSLYGEQATSDRSEYWDREKAKLERDLAKEPEHIKTGQLFVQGSD